MGHLKNKWSWLVHFALFLTVIISLIITFSILSPPREIWNMFQSNDAESEVTTTNTASAPLQNEDVALSEVYRAQSLNYHLSDDSYYQTVNFEILDEVLQYLTSEVRVNVSDDVTVSDANIFREEIQAERFVELEYADQIPARFLIDSISSLAEEYQDVMFNSLVYVEGTDYLAFINEANNHVFKISVSNFSGDNLWTFIEEQKNAFKQVTPYTFAEGRKYLTTEPVAVNKLTYMIERQSNTTYLNQLFDTSQDIQDFSDTNFSRYYSDNQNIMIDSSTSELEYNKEVNNNSEMTAVSMLEASFNSIKSNQLIFDNNWYYMNYKDNLVTYRKFVEGLPVFGENQVSKIQLLMQNNEVSRLQMSTLAAQTPLTDRAEQYELMSGDDAVRLLQASETPIEEVQSVRVGYSWFPSQESSRLVELVPAWYVKVADDWYLLERLVNIRSYPELATINKETDNRVYMEDLIKESAESESRAADAPEVVNQDDSNATSSSSSSSSSAKPESTEGGS